MKRLVYSFGAVLIGAAATMGCTTETDGTGGNGGTGATSQGGGGSGAEGGAGGAGAQGGAGGGSNATVDFENPTYSTNEAGSGQVDVNIVLTLPAGETLTDALTVTVEADGTSTATLGDDVVDPGTLEVTFPAGAANGDMQALAIIPVADVEREGDEDMVLAFASSNTAMTGTNSTVTITDDDALMIGHSRVNGSDEVRNATVDIHDPGTELTDTGNTAIGLVDVEGAAYDSVANVTYIVSDGSQEMLAMVDAAGAVTNIGPTGFLNIQCLAFDPGTSTLYGVDDISQTVVTLDTASGRGTVVGTAGSLTATAVEACAFDSVANILYAVDDANDNLLTIDTTTGVDTIVGSGLTSTNIEGLAFDPATSTLFGSNASNGSLRDIDTTAGTDAAIGTYDDGAAFVQALTYDSTNNVLVGADNAAETIVDITDDAAEVTHVNATGGIGIDALAYDGTNSILYGVANNTLAASLLRWDRATGALLGGIPLGDADAIIVSLATDGTTLWGYNADNGQVVTINATDGTITNLGSPGVGGADLTGMAYGGGVLYASTIDELFTLDTGSGAATTVDAGGYGIITDLEGLAYDNGTLYAIENTTGDAQFLYSIVPGTGVDTDIGFQLATRTVFGLAHDGTSLFGVDDTRTGLVTIDTTDGGVTLIGNRGVIPDGMAYDPDTQTVYISEEDLNWLWAHDLTTGNTSVVGPLFDTAFTLDTFVYGLAFDPTTDTLWGASEYTELVNIDVTTGDFTIAGAFTSTTEVQGLAWDDANTLLYAASNDTVYTVNTTDAALTTVGSFANHDDVEGLGYDPVTSTLFGVDQGLNANESVEAITIDTTSGQSTTLRVLGRGDCTGADTDCSFARGLTFAAPAP